MNYKKHQITKTKTSIDVIKSCYGHKYNTIGYVYEITGEYSKNAMARPWLCSLSDCKEYINNKLDDC